VGKIPGIGEVTERALRALGIETVEQLAKVSPEKLEKIFGQWGDALYRKARGGDSYEFVIDAEPKSISHNHTFGEDTNDTEKRANDFGKRDWPRARSHLRFVTPVLTRTRERRLFRSQPGSTPISSGFFKSCLPNTAI
jgi:nucleotidyltransferase/DNA polymerase involved in DNA repair